MLRYWLATVLVLFCAACAAGGLALAEPVFDVKDVTKNASLGASHGKVLNVTQAAIAVELPTVGTKTMKLDLDAVGLGPQYHWSLYILTNSSPASRDLLVVLPHRAFPGSGLFQPSPTGSLVLSSLAKSDGAPQNMQALKGPAEDVFPIHLEPGQVVALALQGVEPLPDAEIWASEAYSSRQSQLLGLQGAIAGVAGLLMLGTILLAITRRAVIAALCAGFAISCFLFILHELGFLQAMMGAPLPFGITQNALRAAIESMLCAGFIAALAAMRLVTKQYRALYYSLWVGIFLVVANIVFGFFDAVVAMGFARIGIAFLALEGLVLLVRARSTGQPTAISAILFWGALTLWTAIAAVICFTTFALPQPSIFLLLGLCAVMATMGYVLLQNLFERSDYEADIAAAATERSSLALASADHFVWEWRPQHERIVTDQELYRSLGYRGADLEETSQLRFFERVHPEDLPDILEKTGAVAAGASRLLESDIRLSSVEGSYRWFALRARSHIDEINGDLVCLGTLTEITKLKEIEIRLQEDAVHDPVSGLPSRPLFIDRLQRSLANRLGQPIRVLLLDLDRFKIYNDGYGPDIGDQLLMIMARRIQDQIGPEDSATRLTGSQFAIAFNELNNGGDEAFARALMLSLSQPIRMSNREVVISVSGGMSMRGLPGVPADELMTQATSALLSAKQQGLGSLVTYDYGMRNERVAQVALESDLRQAIARGEIEVHYQPIVKLLDGKTAGFEALARWRHPKLGIVSPDQFISAAEEAGLISELGNIVLTEASRQLGIWQRTIARGRNVFVTVNASSSQLLEKEFSGTIQRLMERDMLLPGSLKIEVTEAVVMRYSDRIVSLFSTLRQLGVGLACDDFGTGFSSLSSLRNLPFDTLKLDRSFITAGKDDDRAAHVIRTVLDLAHGLGMTVVCEGVESQDQADRLTEMGCDFGQGYHFGAAALSRHVEDLIAIAPIKPADPAPPVLPAVQNLEPTPAVLPKSALPEELPSLFDVQNTDSVPLPPASGPVLTLTPQRKRRTSSKKGTPRRPRQKR